MPELLALLGLVFGLAFFGFETSSNDNSDEGDDSDIDYNLG